MGPQAGRTDLALEIREGFTEEERALEGIRVKEAYHKKQKLRVTTVTVMDEQGARVMGKPIGTYITIEAPKLTDSEEERRRAVAVEIEKELKSLLGQYEEKEICVIGLGNREFIADALGPMVVDDLFVTRHLVKEMGKAFQKKYRLTSFCAVATGRNGRSTIVNEKDKNLRTAQFKFAREYCSDWETMRSDSHIMDVQKTIAEKVTHFDQYILEENLKKLRRRLSDMLSGVTTLRHREKDKIKAFLLKYEEFERNCQTARDDFIQTIDRIGKCEVTAAFTAVLEELLDEVERRKGNVGKDIVEEIFERNKDQIARDIQTAINNKIQLATEEYQEAIEEAQRRLCDDLQREQKIFEVAISADQLHFHSPFQKGFGFSIKAVSDGALKIFSFAIGGFEIGNILGLIIGAIVGAVLAFLSIFVSKARRINNAKEKIKQTIDDEIDNVTKDVKKKIKELALESEIDANHSKIQNRIATQRKSLQDIELMMDTVVQELNIRYSKV